MSLNADVRDTYILFSELEFELGIINIVELEERSGVLRWLLETSGDLPDPRGGDTDHLEDIEQKPDTEQTKAGGSEPSDEETPPLHFIPRGLKKKWIFTIGDTDFYPSIPHGHLNDPKRSWPKLNPYTGRAFKGSNDEDLSLRLSRTEMCDLWNDQKFRIHALKTIAWYHQAFPSHRFPVPLGEIFDLPRWRRRR